MKAFGKILMNFAFALMMLHNVVPHQHHGEAKEEEHCLAENGDEYDSLLDILSEIFHTDLGNDHLENLRKADGNQSTFLSPALLAEARRTLEQPLVISSEDGYRQPEDLALPDFLIITLRSLRSPPASIQA